MSIPAIKWIARVENIKASMDAGGAEGRRTVAAGGCDRVIERYCLVWARVTVCWSEDAQLVDGECLRVIFACWWIPEWKCR